MSKRELAWLSNSAGILLIFVPSVRLVEGLTIRV